MGYRESDAGASRTGCGALSQNAGL